MYVEVERRVLLQRSGKGHIIQDAYPHDKTTNILLYTVAYETNGGKHYQWGNANTDSRKFLCSSCMC